MFLREKLLISGRLNVSGYTLRDKNFLQILKFASLVGVVARSGDCAG